MENSMTTGIEIKIIGMILKTLSLPAVALFFTPIYDWVVLQVVADYSLLTQFQQALLNDAKTIGGALIVAFALLKLIMGSYKIKKEIEVLKTKGKE